MKNYLSIFSGLVAMMLMAHNCLAQIDSLEFRLVQELDLTETGTIDWVIYDSIGVAFERKVNGKGIYSRIQYRDDGILPSKDSESSFELNWSDGAFQMEGKMELGGKDKGIRLRLSAGEEVRIRFNNMIGPRTASVLFEIDEGVGIQAECGEDLRGVDLDYRRGAVLVWYQNCPLYVNLINQSTEEKVVSNIVAALSEDVNWWVTNEEVNFSYSAPDFEDILVEARGHSRPDFASLALNFGREMLTWDLKKGVDDQTKYHSLILARYAYEFADRYLDEETELSVKLNRLGLSELESFSESSKESLEQYDNEFLPTQGAKQPDPYSMEFDLRDPSSASIAKELRIAIDWYKKSGVIGFLDRALALGLVAERLYIDDASRLPLPFSNKVEERLRSSKEFSTWRIDSARLMLAFHDLQEILSE